MKKQIKVLEVILGIIIVIMTLGMLSTFLLMFVNEDELAWNAMCISVFSILPLFFVAVVLDSNIRRA
jgi:1,4-dihydroxy-2-naphthoate octaprenyltransferase